MGPSNIFSNVLRLALLTHQVTSLGLVKEIYCGLETCYETLGVNRDTVTKQEVRKIYRNLSQKNHPDKFVPKLNNGEITQEEFDAIAAKHQLLTTAYDTLKSAEARKDYDHYLDHPEDRYYNYYRYYAQKYRTDVDVRLVILGSLLCWSLFQWVGWQNSYQSALEYMSQDTKFRIQAKRLAIERGDLDADGKLPKKIRRNFKDPKKEIDRIIREIIKDNMDIRGGHGKPEITDVAIVQCVLLPKHIYNWAKFKATWVYRRRVLKAEYDEEEKWIMIKRNMKLDSNVAFEYMRDKRGAELYAAECWEPENADAFTKKIKEEEIRKAADSGRAKQMKRYLKKHGNSRMTFNDNDEGDWMDE